MTPIGSHLFVRVGKWNRSKNGSDGIPTVGTFKADPLRLIHQTIQGSLLFCQLVFHSLFPLFDVGRDGGIRAGNDLAHTVSDAGKAGSIAVIKGEGRIRRTILV